MTGVLGDRNVPIHIELDLARALGDAELVAVPVPPSVQERYLKLILPHLAAGQAVWLCQGSAASLLPVARARAHELVLIESIYIPYSARRIGPVDVVIRSRLRVPWATFPAKHAAAAARLLTQAFDLPRATSVLEVALQNVNAVLHPLPCLLNWGQIEGREGSFVLVRDGMPPAVLRAMLALDAERTAVCQAAEVSTLGIDELYGLFGVDPPPYRRAPGPGGEVYEHRFIRESVPFGLVTIASAARQLGVATPIVESAIRLCDVIYGTDSWQEGRTMSTLGLDLLDASGIAHALA